MKKQKSVNRLLTLALVWLISLFAIEPAVAQNTASIKGLVQTESNEPLNGVSVTATNLATKKSVSATTNEKGFFSISTLQVGSTYNFTFSYIGYETGYVNAFKLKEGNENSLLIRLKQTAADLTEIVTTATNTKRTQFETPMSITSLNAETIESKKFNSNADILRGIPGIITENSGGAVAANVYVRGLPTGGQYILTPIHIDGMPVLGTAGLNSSATDVYYRNDLNIAKIETALGGVSNLYGSGSVVGLINIISKTGTDVQKTTVQSEFATPGKSQFDFQISGPTGKNAYYSLAGTYRYDNGPVVFGLPTQGYQLRGNLKKILDNGDVFTLYGQYINDKAQYYLPYPIDSTFHRPQGWDGKTIYTLETKDVDNLTVKTPNGVYQSKGANGVFTKGGYLMVDYKHTFLNDLKFDFKAKAANYYHEFNFFNLSGSGVNPAPQGNFATVKLGSTITAFNYTYAGDGTTLNNNALVLENNMTDRIRPVNDFATQFSLTKDFTGKSVNQTLTIGGYFSNTNAGDFNFQINYLSEFNDKARILNLNYTDALGVKKAYTVDGVTTAPQYVNKYLSSIKKAAFLTNEVRIGQKLRVDVGLRVEGQTANVSSEKKATITNADGIKVTWGNGVYDRFDLNASDWALSLASNYKLSNQFAIYGNFSRGYYFPELRSYAVVYSNNVPQYPTLTTEKIKQAEIGIKHYSKNVNASLSAYYEMLDNRRSVAYVLTGGVVNQVTYITGSKAYGIEGFLNYKLSKNFNLYTTLSYINSTYTNFDQTPALVGNTVSRRPNFMNDATLEYKAGGFAFRFNNFYNGRRFADDANTTSFAPYNLSKIDVSYTLKGAKKETVSFNVGIFNLFDNDGITEGNFTAGTTQLNNQKYFIGRPVLPRSFYARTILNF
ncbi:TonB-dependent receptor [Parasediminibacterium paludis]|uniref:TonB-dependent receptor n=1 Tax=Parasediminibacterium paludis TaxID=908966 RepID=A0ABV8PVY2_9BACT